MAEIRVLPQRRSIRLQGYDYASAGAYFITVCARERRCFFGDITDETMMPNEIGQVVEQCWLAIPAHFPDVELDEFTLMPNHLHGILVLPATARGRATHASPLRMPVRDRLGGRLPRSSVRSSRRRRGRSTDYAAS